MSPLPTRFRTRKEIHPKVGLSVYLGRFEIKINGVWLTWAGGSPPAAYHPNGCPTTVQYPFIKAEATLDELHPGPPYLTGGEFQSIKLACDDPTSGVGEGSYDSGSLTVTLSGFGNGPIRYRGYFTNPDWTGLGLPDFNNLPLNLQPYSPLVSNIETLCSKAWDKTKPRIERAGLGIAIKEATDIPRMLRTSSKLFNNIWKATLRTTLANTPAASRYGRLLAMREMAPKKAADHFINHNFGWVPFVSDTVAFCATVIDRQEIISRISDENGKWTRRRATLVDDYTVTKINSGSGTRVEPYGLYIDYLCNGTPTWELWKEEITIASSVGSFTYFRPEFDRANPEFNSLMNRVRRDLAIHGVRVSPSNIYKSIPWTWAIDWFTNTGKWVNRLNDQFIDQVVARYLFVHHRKYQRYTLKQYMPFKSGARTFEFSRVIEVKQRKSADTPYGFGLSWDDLSPKQLAILAALGVLRT